jgi:hypothetical protein
VIGGTECKPLSDAFHCSRVGLVVLSLLFVMATVVVMVSAVVVLAAVVVTV